MTCFVMMRFVMTSFREDAVFDDVLCDDALYGAAVEAGEQFLGEFNGSSCPQGEEALLGLADELCGVGAPGQVTSDVDSRYLKLSTRCSSSPLTHSPVWCIILFLLNSIITSFVFLVLRIKSLFLYHTDRIWTSSL